ncbi:hypothetical protein [Mesorhizobium sp. M1E.F.Ca.ET.063.01.1.1]|nr:hypothetical protein [Mesorhizobium sp. M1E.F.Ca.ET.063.01.1.1]
MHVVPPKPLRTFGRHALNVLGRATAQSSRRSAQGYHKPRGFSVKYAVRSANHAHTNDRAKNALRSERQQIGTVAHSDENSADLYRNAVNLDERLVVALPPFFESFKRIMESVLKGDWSMPFEETRKHLLHVHILSFRMIAPDNKRYSEGQRFLPRCNIFAY